MGNAKEIRRAIRKNIRQSRREVAAENRVAWDDKICERFLKSTDFQNAHSVAGFLAFDGEADPLALMTTAVKSGKQVFVPIIIAKKQPLKFAPWSPNVAMKPNRFGILEPDVQNSKWVGGDQLDFVITPLVAFDESCNRFGVGGGFYDRTFAFLNKSSNESTRPEKSTCLIGFAYELQKIDSIKSKVWDVPLDGVITESETYQRSA